MYFSKHHRMLLKQENSDLTFGDLGKTVGAMWKAAAADEKRPFEELAAEDKSRYVNELSDYRSAQADEHGSGAPNSPKPAAHHHHPHQQTQHHHHQGPHSTANNAPQQHTQPGYAATAQHTQQTANARPPASAHSHPAQATSAT